MPNVNSGPILSPGCRRDVALVNDAGIDVFVEPFVVEGPAAFVAFVLTVTVFDEPFPGVAVLGEVHTHESHRVTGGTGMETDPVGLANAQVDPEERLVIEQSVFHHAVLIGLIGEHVHGEPDRFVGED